MAFDDRLRTILDCTGGFWSEQDWSGVFLHRLLPETGEGRSVRVVSRTGYERRFPISDLPRLLLATRLGGEPLSADHGHPARLVVADRRGFWWVKWVVGVELESLPSWLQLPFPLQ
jgi:DMSO/TMAO reductase YedYZ molybdopterin-dependent catalytic subunit